MNNCTNGYPHYPPHCGCPAFTLEFGRHSKTEDGGEEETRGGHDCE